MGIKETRKRQTTFRKVLKASIFFTCFVILTSAVEGVMNLGVGDSVGHNSWIIYLMRATEVFFGVLLILSFLFSLIYKNKRKSVPLSILGVIIITGLHGIVELWNVPISLLAEGAAAHVLFVFVIITGQVYAYVKTAAGKRTMSSFKIDNTTRYAIGVLIGFTIVLSVFGAQIRQQIDVIATDSNFLIRHTWVGQLNWKFLIHRSFSILILLGNAWICYQLIKYMNDYFAVYRAAIYLAVFVGFQVIIGILMAYFGVPVWCQPLHLVLSCLIFGTQAYLFIVLGSSRRIQTQSMTSN